MYIHATIHYNFCLFQAHKLAVESFYLQKWVEIFIASFVLSCVKMDYVGTAQQVNISKSAVSMIEGFVLFLCLCSLTF